MPSATLINMTALAHQKPDETDLSEDLSPDPRVGQAVDPEGARRKHCGIRLHGLPGGPEEL